LSYCCFAPRNTVTPFNLANAAEHEYAALNRFLNIMGAEKTPDGAEIVACAFAEFLKREA
jgi:hypothetical protein